MAPQKKAKALRSLRCADRTLAFEHPHIMGVLNITPDSFSDGGQYYRFDESSSLDLDNLVQQATAMVAAGASVLDIGGESTRPGAQPVSNAEELERVLPVVDALRHLDVVLSVDTRHAEVAAACIEAGAKLINDVSAGSDTGMLKVIAHSKVGYAFMHMQGTPETMQNAPSYQAVVEDVRSYLLTRMHACLNVGIAAERLMLDPGFGFGKTLEHNLQLLAHLEAVRLEGLPLLVGISRKSMLGAITGREVEQRLPASIAAAIIAVQNGADMVRVHDVEATSDALKVLTSVQSVL